MIKIYHRYLFLELLGPFALCLGIFTFVLFMGNILKMTELVITRGVDAFDLFRLFLYLLPNLLSLSIPIAMLVCTTIAFSRLSGDSEIVALKASGISLYQMLLPVAVFSLATFLLTLFLTVAGGPWGLRMFRDLLYDITRKKASLVIKERVFIDDYEGFMIYVNRVPPEGDALEGVLISDRKIADQPTIIIAKRGYIQSNEEDRNVSLLLKDGAMYRSNPERNALQRVHFDSYNLNLDLPERKGTDQRRVKNSEMTLRDLLKKIEERRKEDRIHFRELVDLHQKFSIPFACIVFGLIGIPLGLQTGRGGRFHGFVLGVGAILVYYALFAFGQALGERGKVHPMSALWAPNILLSVLGLYLFSATAREKEVPFIRWASVLLDRLGQRISRIKGP